MINLHSFHKTSSPKSRVGRGISAGQGKTAGRGTKGQKSRSGYNIPRRFEGGQSALIQRLPKRTGFKHYGAKPLALNISHLTNYFKEGDTVNPETLVEKGAIKSIPTAGIKIIGQDPIAEKLTFEGVTLSRSLQPKPSN